MVVSELSAIYDLPRDALLGCALQLLGAGGGQGLFEWSGFHRVRPASLHVVLLQLLRRPSSSSVNLAVRRVVRALVQHCATLARPLTHAAMAATTHHHHAQTDEEDDEEEPAPGGKEEEDEAAPPMALLPEAVCEELVGSVWDLEACVAMHLQGAVKLAPRTIQEATVGARLALLLLAFRRNYPALQLLVTHLPHTNLVSGAATATALEEEEPPPPPPPDATPPEADDEDEEEDGESRRCCTSEDGDDEDEEEEEGQEEQDPLSSIASTVAEIQHYEHALQLQKHRLKQQQQQPGGGSGEGQQQHEEEGQPGGARRASRDGGGEDEAEAAAAMRRRRGTGGLGQHSFRLLSSQDLAKLKAAFGGGGGLRHHHHHHDGGAAAEGGGARSSSSSTHLTQQVGKMRQTDRHARTMAPPSLPPSLTGQAGSQPALPHACCMHGWSCSSSC